MSDNSSSTSSNNQKLQASFVTVEMWNNESMSYDYVGELIWARLPGAVDKRSKKPAIITGFTYHEDYNGPPLDPAGLDYRKNGRSFVSSRVDGKLRKFFHNMLPGVFGNRVLQSSDKGWLTISEAQRLGLLSKVHSDFDAIRLNAYLGEEDLKIIDDRTELDTIVKKIVAYSADQLKDILGGYSDNDKKRLKNALTNLKGARGKVDYVHSNGKRFVAKPGLLQDDWNVVRVEYAMGVMEKAAQINSVDSRWISLPSGNEVLMSKRYDQDDGLIHRDNEGNPVNCTMRKQYNRISMKAILTQMSSMSSKTIADASYIDIKNAILQYSAQPVKDVEELYRRIIFHTGMNNSDNNLGNFEMYIDDKSEWRLSPSYDVLPDPDTNSEFAVSITDSITRVNQIDFNEDFLESIAEKLNIDPERGKVLAKSVIDVIADSEKYLSDNDVQDNDIQKIISAFRVSEAQALKEKLQTGFELNDIDWKSHNEIESGPKEHGMKN
ncbi:MAG: HipA domain-containing protein [Methylococcales bacterium]